MTRLKQIKKVNKNKPLAVMNIAFLFLFMLAYLSN